MVKKLYVDMLLFFLGLQTSNFVLDPFMDPVPVWRIVSYAEEVHSRVRDFLTFEDGTGN
jgi:hypothetical protein